MRTIMAVLFCLSMPFIAYADVPADGSPYEQIVDNTISFRDVFLQNREANVGLPYSTTLRLVRWSQLPEEALASHGHQQLEQNIQPEYHSIIGLTKTHRLYQHIQIGNVHFARRLSGIRCIRDFRVLRNGLQLIALDCSGRLLVYSPLRWSESRFGRIVMKRAAQAIGWAAAIGISTYIWQRFGSHVSGVELKFLTGVATMFGGAGMLLSHGAAAVAEYGRSNRTPDGFIKTPLRIDSLDLLSPQQLESAVDGEELANHWTPNCATLLANRPPKFSIQNFDEDKFE